MKKTIILFLLFIVAGTVFANYASAEIPPNNDLPNLLQASAPSVVIGRITKYMVGLAGTIALIFFIYGGCLWLISAGRPDYVTKGRNAMVWAGIGLVVIFASYALVYLAYRVIKP